MESSNPVFKRTSTEIALRGNTTVVPSTAELDNLYNAPAASSIRTGRMTIDDVVARTAMCPYCNVVRSSCNRRSTCMEGKSFNGICNDRNDWCIGTWLGSNNEQES